MAVLGRYSRHECVDVVSLLPYRFYDNTARFLADLDNVENVELKSPHQGFRTFLVIGPDNRPTVERISTAEPAAQPDGPPPAASDPFSHTSLPYST